MINIEKDDILQIIKTDPSLRDLVYRWANTKDTFSMEAIQNGELEKRQIIKNWLDKEE